MSRAEKPTDPLSGKMRNIYELRIFFRESCLGPITGAAEIRMSGPTEPAPPSHRSFQAGWNDDTVPLSECKQIQDRRGLRIDSQVLVASTGLRNWPRSGPR